MLKYFIIKNMNNNRLLKESLRMIELFGEDSKKTEFIKSKLKSKLNKENINESGLGLSYDIPDDGDTPENNEREDEAIEKLYNWDSENDISKEFKTALLTNISDGLDKEKALSLGFTEDDFVKESDLYTVRQVAGKLDDEGEIVYVDKNLVNLYKLQDRDDFRNATKKGKVFIKSRDNAFYKLLANKNLYSIGYLGKDGKVSDDGNATLNFLARVLSKKGLRPGEKEIIDLAGKSNSERVALNILKDFYTLAAEIHIKPIISWNQKTPEQGFDLHNGVLKAIYDLQGVKTHGTGEKDKDFSIGKTNWNGKSNVGPWLLQIVKNWGKDINKRDTNKIGRPTDKAVDFLSDMLKHEGVITIVSSKEPSHEHAADDVKKVGDKWHYIYKNVMPAIDDLKASQSVPAHHMKVQFVSTEKYGPLYSSERIAPTFMPDDKLQNISDKSMGVDDFKIEDFYKGAEIEIKNTLDDAVEFMLKQIKIDDKGTAKNEYGLSKNKLSTENRPDSKVVKHAKDNVVNFLYNFIMPTLLKSVGKTITTSVKDNNPKSPTYGEMIRVVDTRSEVDFADKISKAVRDVEESGNISSDAMESWIDSQNEKMINALKSKSDKPEEELRKLAKKAGLLVPGGSQGLWRGLRDYLEQNPSAFSKIMNSIDLTSPEGYEQDVELALEQKIRAKIRKILRESFVIKEGDKEDDKEDDFEYLEEDDFEYLDYQINILSDRYVDKYGLSNKKKVLDSEIKNVINSGKSKYGYLNNFSEFKYMTHIMANLWNNLTDDYKKNVNNYIINNLYSNPAVDKFKNYLIKGLEKKAPLIARNKIEDIVGDVIHRDKGDSGILPTEAAMNSFNPTVGVSYLDWLAANINQMGRSRLQKEPEFSHGEQIHYTNYLDAPIGGEDDEGNERTFLDALAPSTEDDEKLENPRKKAWEYMGKFLKDNNKLKGPQLEMLPLIIDPEAGKKDKKGKGAFSPSVAANIMGITDGNARAIYSRVKKAIKDALLDPNEELVNYIKEKTGVDLKTTKLYTDVAEVVAENKLKRFKNLTKENIELLREFFIK